MSDATNHDQLVVGLERYNVGKFIREFHNFRTSHIGQRVTHIDSKFQLSQGCVLHILDNFGQTTHQDTPRVESNPLIMNEEYKKFMIHVSKLNLDGPMKFTDRFIHRTAGMNGALTKFRSKYLSMFKFPTSLAEIPKQREALVILNHNPAFRVFLQGQLRSFRKLQIVLSSVINTALTLPEDKVQYIYIPLTEKIYAKDTFNKTKREWTMASVKYPESDHWMFMANLLNLWDTHSENSWFQSLSESDLRRINIALVVPYQDGTHHAIFYNLAEIAALNENNRLYNKLVAHINLLAATGYTKADAILATAPVETTTMDVPSENTPYIDDNVGTDTSQEIEKALDAIADIQDEDINLHEEEAAPPTTIPPAEKEAIPPIDPIILPMVETKDESIFSQVKEIYRPTLKKTANSNITTVKAPVMHVDTPGKASIEDVFADRDRMAEEFIERQTQLTPKQKERCRKLANVYKGISINGRTIEDIMLTDVDTSVTSQYIEIPDSPDSNLTVSRVMGYDRSYLDKTATRDLLSLVSAFGKQGMYLLDIETTPVITELNRSTQYVLRYEEYTGKKHTVRFTIPMVDPDGTCLINGSKKTLRKQMLNLPICKVSPTRVSLSSNMNKTIVERNLTKAHSFISHLSKAITVGVGIVGVTYGSMNLNKCIAYEYVAAATKYRSITVRDHDTGQFQITFDYPQRHTDLTKNELSTVVKGEKSHGVYIGRYNTNTYGFIGLDNQIVWIDSNGKPNKELPTSIIGIFKRCYPTDKAKKIGTVTEWTDLKILDKKFPIAFILAYRFGLTETLRHLGVKFEILGKRSNTIMSDIDTSLLENFSKVKYLDEIAELKLKSDECIIGGSAAAVLYGAKSTNADIDLMIPSNVLKKLIAKQLIVPVEGKPGTYTNGKHLDVMEVGTGAMAAWTESDWYDNSREYLGYTWMTKKSLIELYRILSDTLQQAKHRNVLNALESEDVLGMERLGLNGVPTRLPKYFHITPKDLGPQVSMWAKIPAGIDEADPDPNMKENFYIPRLCMSTSIDGAVTSLYKNHFDKMGKFKDFHVYGYDGPRDKTKIMHTEELIRCKFVPDAHVTQEIWITETTRMKKIGTIRVFNQVKYKIEYTEFNLQFNAKKHTATCMKWEWIPASYVVANEALSTKPNVYQMKDNDIVLNFKDCRLVFNRYPLQQSLIVSGFDMFDTSDYTLDEFDRPDVYYSLLGDKGIRTNYLKGIDSFFELFIDDITKDVLQQMNEPTNVRDLLLRSTELLCTMDHKEASAMANYRIRGFEQFNAIVYNEMARSLAHYRVRNTKDNTFSLNPEAVFQRIIKNESFLMCDQINPIQDLKDKTGITYAGSGGRTSQSFVVNDRRFPEDGVGILSEASVDGGKVALNAFLTVDPAIVNTRGIIIPTPIEKANDTLSVQNSVSAPSAIFPFSVNDDGKRAMFISTQSSHVLPVRDADVCRIRTGYERAMRYHVSDLFVGTAKDDGIVTKVSPEDGVMKVEYKDGTSEIFQIGEVYAPISGFYATHRITVNVEEGTKIKKNDIVCYHEDFFKKDAMTGEVDFSIGTDANLMLVETDTTLEDSNAITKTFSERFVTTPTMERIVELSADSIIYEMKSIGDHVQNVDSLLIFEEGEAELYGSADEELTDMLSQLNRKLPTAKYNGTIVEIHAYYSCALTDMHPSVRKIVDACIKRKNKRATLAKGSLHEYIYTKSESLPVGSKFKGVTFTEDTVLLQFLIKHDSPHEVGDKLIFCNQLKSTTNKVIEHAPYTESGVVIDAQYSVQGVAARVVLSPFLLGMASRVLEKTELDVVDMYFSK